MSITLSICPLVRSLLLLRMYIRFYGFQWLENLLYMMHRSRVGPMHCEKCYRMIIYAGMRFHRGTWLMHTLLLLLF